MSCLASIVMPVFNAEKFAGEALNSLLTQTYQNFEIIVVDDDSQDKSADIIASYSDPRIRYYKNQTRSGIGKTINRGILLARGEYIARTDADDVSYPQKLEKQVIFLKTHQDIDVVFTRVAYIDDAGQSINWRYWPIEEKTFMPEQICNTLPRVNCVTQTTVMFRAACILKNLYDENIRAEDYELWLRLAAQGIRMGKINEILLNVRKHPSSITQIWGVSRGGIELMVEVKKVFLRKNFVAGKIDFFTVKVFIFLIKDCILLKLRFLIRLFWPNFDRQIVEQSKC